MRIHLVGRAAVLAGIALLCNGLAARPGAAQQATVTGRVIDADTGRGIVDADVIVGGAETSTDARGRFTLSVAPGTTTVRATRISYADASAVVTLASGDTVSVELALEPAPTPLDAILVITGDRLQPGRVGTHPPAASSAVDRDDIDARPVRTVGDLVLEMPGVDAPHSSLGQQNIVARGFNNAFSGALLVLTDYRYARVPSLRLNAYNMIPVPTLDMERVEVVLGPASALYGPNSASGVMHVLTSSPIDRPGTSVSLGGGNRSIFTAAFRQAFRFDESLGLKATGQYFRGRDFEYRDPAEDPDPMTPRVGARDFDIERFGGEARLDWRPWDGSTDGVTLAYGHNELVSSIELTGIGAGQARDWRYRYGQVTFRRAGLFVQGFLNASDAGDTFLLRTGQDIVDRSTVLAGQIQYTLEPVDLVALTAGVDVSQTTPRTDGTINGANEYMDETLEIGGYLSGRVDLHETLQLVGALRVDHHEHLPDPVWSPRVGLLLEPAPGRAFRATYNRAFGTPTTNNLFLDIIADQFPVLPGVPVAYRVRTTGVPSTGYTWNDRCTGGVNDYCMYSPFAPGAQLPATGTALWDGVVVPFLLTIPEAVDSLAAMGLSPTDFRSAVAGPTPADIGTVLGRLDHEDGSFSPDPGVSPVRPLRPTITTSYEVGYQGLLSERMRLSVSVYRNEIQDFVGPLRVETPSVFFDGPSLGAFLAARLQGAGASAAQATSFAGTYAPLAAMAPLGTVAPDQRSSSDLVLTYRNFGDVALWGADLGLEASVTDRWTVSGAYSWVDRECFDFDGDRDCSGSRDIALNAPTQKGVLGVRYSDRRTGGSGIALGVRGRYSGSFPMNSGVYIGEVDAYTVFDVNAAYDVPGWAGATIGVTLNNLLNHEHREFVGAPAMGMVALVQLQYTFGDR